jgi:hypothetical protein
VLVAGRDRGCVLGLVVVWRLALEGRKWVGEKVHNRLLSSPQCLALRRSWLVVVGLALTRVLEDWQVL